MWDDNREELKVLNVPQCDVGAPQPYVFASEQRLVLDIWFRRLLFGFFLLKKQLRP